MESVPQNHLPLRCEPEYGAIVCFGCNHGFPEKSIARHVSSRHDIFVDVYGPILESFQHETLAKGWSDLSRPADGSAPIEGLEIEPGVVCIKCGFRTTGGHVAKKHCSKCGPFRRVDLQCWNPNGAPKYWI